MKDKQGPENTNQPVSASNSFDLCNSCSLTAASPLGSLERPLSMSLTDDCVSPMAAPISATVIPFRRRSEMREDQVIMAASIRNTDILCNRHSATEFRKNVGMARPTDLPTFDSIGARVRWWRRYRGLSQAQLAAKADISQSTLSGLENEEQVSSTKLNRLAEALQVNAHYLETDEGDPEPIGQLRTSTQAGQLPPWWPFKSIGKADLAGLNEVERSYAETQLAQALAMISSLRRKKGS